jgi:hypothetical protein
MGKVVGRPSTDGRKRLAAGGRQGAGLGRLERNEWQLQTVLHGPAIDSGHYMAEEVPEETTAELRSFFAH